MGVRDNSDKVFILDGRGLCSARSGSRYNKKHLLASVLRHWGSTSAVRPARRLHRNARDCSSAAARDIRKRLRPLTKSTVRHAAWLIPRFRSNDALSPLNRAMGGPCREKSAPKFLDRWKSGVLLGKSELTDERLVRTDEEVENARSVRRLAEHGWSEVNLRAVVETPQKPKSTTVDIPLAAEPLALPPEAPEIPEGGTHSETRGRRNAGEEPSGHKT